MVNKFSFCSILIFFSIFFNIQFLKAQTDSINDIVKKDTLDVFIFNNINSLKINDFKFHKDNFTFIFSKQDFIKELKKASIFSRNDLNKISRKAFKKEQVFLEKIIETNKEISYLDLDNTLERRLMLYHIIPTIEILLNKQKIKIFYNNEPILIIYKVRIKRIGKNYSSSSIKYFGKNTFIFDRIESATID